MRGSCKRAQARRFVLCLLAAAVLPAWGRQSGGGPPQADGATAAAEATAGRNALTAGLEPRVRLPQGSRDHAAIFGTDDEDELALMEQERALEAQRNQLGLLERILDSRPARADPQPPAMIPLDAGVAGMPRLTPAQAGSKLDDGGSGIRRSMDEMQRRVDGLRREADALRQRAR